MRRRQPLPNRHPRPPSRGSIPPALQRFAAGGVDPRVKPEDDGGRGGERPAASGAAARAGLATGPRLPLPNRHPRPPSRGSIPQALQRFAAGGVDPRVKPEDDGGRGGGYPAAAGAAVRTGLATGPRLPLPNRHPRPPSRGSIPPALQRFAAGGMDPRVEPEDDGGRGGGHPAASGTAARAGLATGPRLPLPNRHPRPPSRGSIPPALQRFAAGGMDPRVEPEDDGGRGGGHPAAAGAAGRTGLSIAPRLPLLERHPRPPSRGSIPPALQRFAAGGMDPRVKPEEDGGRGAG